MRKNVECAFGILKGRWRILKTGIRVRSLDTADNIWYTCCALHNMLLTKDGLNERWDKGVAFDKQSDYLGELGLHAQADAEEHVPIIFQRVIRGQQGDIRTYDASSHLSFVSEPIPGDAPLDALPPPSSAPIAVNDISFRSFRNLLVEHFTDMFNKNALVWPSRNGVMTTTSRRTSTVIF
jgi:hypothetical protein